MRSIYTALISEATGCTDPQTLARIEQVMRETVFHSTLDWIDRPTFIRGAREAYGIVRIQQRDRSSRILPEDTATARLLGVQPEDVPGLARFYRRASRGAAA